MKALTPQYSPAMPTDNDDEPAFDYAAMIREKRENEESNAPTQKRHEPAAKSTGKPAAKKVATPNIATKGGRDKLAPRDEAYWSKLAIGLYVGYRKFRDGSGSWNGRYRGDDGKQLFNTMGDKLGSYDAAADAVRAWAKGISEGLDDTPTTVAEACRYYVSRLLKDKPTASSSKDADGRFKRLIYDARIGSIKLAKLSFVNVETWRDEQIQDADPGDEMRRAKDTSNRNLASLKAALNLALSRNLVSSNRAWKEVNKFENTGKKRQGFLSREERKTLLDAMPAALRTFCTAIQHTGARPGEIAKASARDFDKATNILYLDGKTGHRPVRLSATAREFFGAQAADKLPSAPLLTMADGERWYAQAWGDAMREVRTTTAMPEAVCYSFRHSAISEMISQGIDVFTVAKLTGTSVAMIESNYGEYVPDELERKLNALEMF